MEKVIEPMTSGSIGKRMMFFALPLLLGNLFQQLYNTVDSLIVGNFLGSSALAAVSSSGSLIFMLIGFLSGISAGAGVVISQYFRAEDVPNIQRAVHTAVAFGIAAGLLMTIVGILLSPQILAWMGTPESVMPESISYLQIYFSGSLGFVLYNVFVGILQAALMIWIIRVLKLSTRLTPDTAASPTEDTIKVSARPMVTLNACSAISGSSSATSACRGNRGVDVNLDDFMLSSVANDKKARMLLSYSGSCRNARGCIQESVKKQQPAAFRALYPWAQLC